MDESETIDNQTTETNETGTTNETGSTSDVTFNDDVFSQDFSPDFGIDFGSNNNSDSFDFSYNPFDDSGSDFGDALFGDSGSSETPEDDSKSEPTMTVDEVYGKGNQSIVESQGDYAASSNEKSNVETSTLGKQDSISVTPQSVTENKGLVDNPSIASIEGLNFQQKDRESQEVLDARKSRDETESKDKANQMREQLIANQESLKAKTDLTADEKEAMNKFQIGNSGFEEQNKAKLAELNQKNQELEDARNKQEKLEAKAEEAKKAYKEKSEEFDSIIERNKQIVDRLNEVKDEKDETAKYEMFKSINDEFNLGLDAFDLYNPDGDIALLEKLANEKENLSAELDNYWEAKVKASHDVREAKWDADKKQDEVDKANQDYKTWEKEYWAGAEKTKAEEETKERWDKLEEQAKAVTPEVKDALRDAVNWVKDAYEKGEMSAGEAVNRLQNMTLMADYSPLGLKTADMVYLAGGLDGKYLASNPSALQASYVGAEKAPEVAPKTNAVTPEAKTKATENTPSKAEASIQAAREALKSSGLSPEQQAQAEQMLSDIEASRQEVIEASSKLTNNLEGVNPADIKTFIDKTEQYHKILKDDLKGNPFTKTDFNRTFTKSIVDAIDLGEITLADGTKTSYSQLSIDMATRSPEVAKAMYEAKADRLEKDGHNILAKIERAKAEMSQTWLGSKLTWADNRVRNQFIQMAKTNERATYATYNNVRNDKTGKYSEAKKAEASAAILQANSLRTASAALEASTGFWSGIRDSPKDGVYGTTNPKDLNTWQKTLNAVDNLAKITLGLGVTPAANKAYLDMYYMAGDKVNKSFLFNKDFDGDGFALCQEYGNSATAGMMAGAGELAAGVVLVFNPSTVASGIDLIVDSIKTFTDGLYGVQKEARKSEEYTKEVLDYFEEAKDIVAETGNKEAADTIDNAITRIENFELKSDEVGNLDNWLEGSGSNTADNGKFNQSLTYDEWLKLIEADPTMQEYAKKLMAEKKS